MRNALPLVLLVVVACFEACGGNSNPSTPSPTPAPSATPTPSPTVTVTSVALTGTAPAVGATSQYTATATFSNGSTQNVTGQATWQSSNSAVVTVSSGLLTGAGLGEADLRATYQGVTGLTQVFVTTVAPAHLAVSTTASQGWNSITVTVNGQTLGTITRLFEPGGASSCVPVDNARLVATVQPGNIAWSARSDRGTTWNGTQQLAAGACYEVQLTCPNRDCSPPAPPPPPPPPPPAPPSVPPPTPTAGFYVWGGQNYSQYLGFFTCVFCTEFASDSINNQFGTYGSQFSSTSIRNQFSQYGSQFSTFSACDQFASNPPRVYNPNRSVYYGELTLNQFRSDAIKTANIVNWLTGDVCRH